MKMQHIFGVLAVLTLLATTCVHAQKATERYIPVGKSPGISGKYTSIGTIDSVNMDERTLTCTDSSGTITVKIDKNTKIWIDRSKQKLQNMEGSLYNCQQGEVVEVKYRNNNRQPGAVADWIKVRPAGSP
jgi:hypothetical protein